MKAHFSDLLSPRKHKMLLWVFALLCCYAVVGFLILPPIVRAVAEKQLSKQLNRPVTIRKITFNPFTFSVSVRGLLITDPDGQPFISWDEVYVNFQLASFLGHAWVFKEINVSNPHARVQLNKDYTLNFSDLVEKFSANTASGRPSHPLALRIDRLRIAGATIALADFTPREPFKRLVGPLDITLQHFRTSPDHKNPYSFTGTTDAGETISWSGYFYLDPLRSEGEFKLFNLALRNYAPLYQDLVRFEVRDGSVAADVKYRFEFSANNRVAQVYDTDYELRDFKVGLPGQSNNVIDVPLFSLLGADVDLPHHQATLESVQLTGARALLRRNADSAVNVVEMAEPAASATNASGGILFLLRSVTNTVALLLESTNQWSATVHHISATNCEMRLEDFTTPRPARLDLTDIALDAANLSNQAGTNLTADFSLRWNTNGAIHLGAAVAFQPTAADLQLDFDHLNVPTLDAYLASRLDVSILNSDVNLHGKVRLRPQVNNLPVVSFNGDASLDNFDVVDGTSGQNLLRWDAIQFKHISANLNPPLVALGEISLNNVFARVIVETNHSLNLENIFKPASAAPPGNPPVPATATTNPAIQFSVHTIVITNSAVEFSDFSLQPRVHLALQSLNGSISGLSSEHLQHAVVDLHGAVNGTGPVTVTGTLNGLEANQTNDLKVTFKNVDLTPTSPYAGKFAGYAIAEGKLDLDLDYRIAGKTLAAQNVITLDQFSLGDKVDSPDATHLPVRLAVAIMKDRNGQIVLDVPVAGNLNDPQFRIGKVVTRAVENILEKVAASPFSLLGAAFGGGGEELGWQEFAPGGADLSIPDQKKLQTLAKALDHRPALKIEITGSVDADGDREGLERAALDREIRSRMWRKLRKSEQATTSVAQIVLTPVARRHYIEQIATAAFASGKITPAMIAANTNLAAYAVQAQARLPNVRKGAQLLMQHASGARTPPLAAAKPASKLVPPPDPLEALVLATFPIRNDDLETLAVRRALAVQSYLVQKAGADAGRIFVVAGSLQDFRRDGSRAFLQLR